MPVECRLEHWLHPMSPEAPLYINHIIEDVIHPQQEAPDNPLNHNDVANVFTHDAHMFSVSRFLLDLVGGIVSKLSLQWPNFNSNDLLII